MRMASTISYLLQAIVLVFVVVDSLRLQSYNRRGINNNYNHGLVFRIKNSRALLGNEGIDVSGLPFISKDLNQISTSPFGGVSDISNALIIAGGLGYFLYEKRPRGSARDDLIEVRKSNIPGANLGVFAKKFVGEGTVLGRFPGFLRSTEEALASSKHFSALSFSIIIIKGYL